MLLMVILHMIEPFTEFALRLNKVDLLSVLNLSLSRYFCNPKLSYRMLFNFGCDKCIFLSELKVAVSICIFTILLNSDFFTEIGFMFGQNAKGDVRGMHNSLQDFNFV